MRALLLGLTLLCACSNGSDLFAPSAPLIPNVYPHGNGPGGDGPQTAQHAASRGTSVALGRAPH